MIFSPGSILIAFTIAVLPLALRSGAWITFVALAAIGVALIAVRRHETARVWAPIVVAPLLYFTLPDLMSGWAGGEVGYRDPAVLGWEQSLFGGQPARELYLAVPNCLVSEALHLGYLSYYPLIFVPPLLLWRRGDRQGVERAVTALAIAFVACFVVFIVFPVQGPRYLWPDPQGMCSGPVREVVLAVLERGSSRGAAFPSSHVAVATAQALSMTFARLPRVWVVWIFAAALALGAVHGGFHYAVDAVAGLLVGAAAALLAHSRRISATRSAAVS